MPSNQKDPAKTQRFTRSAEKQINMLSDRLDNLYQDIYTTVGKKLFKELHIFFKITNIVTDLDFIGINEIVSCETKCFE